MRGRVQGGYVKPLRLRTCPIFVEGTNVYVGSVGTIFESPCLKKEKPQGGNPRASVGNINEEASMQQATPPVRAVNLEDDPRFNALADRMAARLLGLRAMAEAAKHSNVVPFRPRVRAA